MPLCPGIYLRFPLEESLTYQHFFWIATSFGQQSKALDMDGGIGMLVNNVGTSNEVPMNLEEQKYFCATGLIGGQRKFIAFQRAPQGTSVAPTLWVRLARGHPGTDAMRPMHAR